MSTAAARMRSYRARQRAGRVLVSVELDETDLVATLVAHGFLDPCEADDAEKVSGAVGRVLRALIADHRSRYL